MTYTLRPYQRAAVADFLRYFETHAGNPIIVMPAGSGKSLVIAECIRIAVEAGTRCLVTTHVKELVEQDAEKLEALMPPGTVGVYSAGLGRRDTSQPVIVAGIQSVFRKIDELTEAGEFGLVFVDEAHLVPHDKTGRYRELIDALLARNPYLKTVGFTATPFRMKGGYLHAGKSRVFTHIAHSVDIVKLIDEGFLSPIVAKSPETKFDTSNVAVRGGEFVTKALEEIVDDDERVSKAVEEIVTQGADRNSWLVFCCSVKHAQHVAEEIRGHGIRTEIVTGDTASGDRDRLIADFREGRIRCIVNISVLTTGFDAPGTDLVVLLRPTRSAALFVQMVGRGMRIAPGKKDALVLDFGQNVQRHGPINSIQVDAKTDVDGELEAAPTKECPECLSILHAAIRECPDCGFLFPEPKPKHAIRAASVDVIARPKVSVLSVDFMSHARHKGKNGKRDSVVVTYLAGLRQFREWLCFEHGGYAASKAADWWAERSPGTPVPETVADALERLGQGEATRPEEIRIEEGPSQYPNVLARIGAVA